ncbi:hypothetical protein Patl1_23727 [Pistacia atlantica]|uniref:Uncharacterized protein n=1 Tax=Pistacia atlantica TaxID=434234 RepID=A0ACC0ZYQ6_9ROSI|nr:hypothetical protein Patl1_23727 [Pistacia atlantica]
MAPTSTHDYSCDDNCFKTVCVMDASGHLGSSLVHRLLHRGYTVHAAVQTHGSLKSYEELRSSNKKLKEVMAEVEVRAAHNVLEACAQTDTIDKVVFTSSITAVIWNDDRNTTSSDLEERNWSDINFCKKYKLWHALSKTVAEKTAWALAMDRGINMVSINGGLMMSPDLTITNPYLKGAAEMYEDGLFVTVDLRFSVDAYICVFEDVSSYGRYLCFNHVISCNNEADELTRILLSTSDNTHPLSLEDTRVHQQRISNKKLNKLMVNFEEGLQVDCSEA